MNSIRARNQRLVRLCELMREADDLAEPLGYFLEHLANDPGFFRRSTSGDPGLAVLLEGIARRLLGDGVRLGSQCFMRYDALWHGCSVFGTTLATVLYHTERGIGLVSVPLADSTALIRFTVVKAGVAAGARRRSG